MIRKNLLKTTMAVMAIAISLGLTGCSGCGKKEKTDSKDEQESMEQVTKAERETVTSVEKDGVITVYQVVDNGLLPIETITGADTVVNKESVEPEKEAQVSEVETNAPDVEPVIDLPYTEPDPTPAPDPEAEPETEYVLNNMPYPYYTLCSYDGMNGYFSPRDFNQKDLVRECSIGGEATVAYGSSNKMYVFTFDDVGKTEFQSFWGK